MGYEPDFGREPAPSMPPQWAINRAQEMTGYVTPVGMINAFARYIAKHEQPPVDPDVLAVREILEAYSGLGSGLISRGDCDGLGTFQAALTAFRKHKEAGK